MAADTAHLDSAFRAALSRFQQDAPGGGVSIFSGFRSVEHQQQLWDQALKKYGSAQVARKWVAPPGHSQHNKGMAADLQFTTPAARSWAHQHAADYGLNFPLSNESWHIEPIGARGGQKSAATPIAQALSARTVDSVTAALSAIRNVESNGNYKARNKYSSASGAYQFIDKTWRAAAGPQLAAVYAQAWMAPNDVQDRVARQHLQSLLSANGGDISLTPISWFTGHTGATARALVGSTTQPGGAATRNATIKAYETKWNKAFNAASGQMANPTATTYDSSYNLSPVFQPRLPAPVLPSSTPVGNPRASSAFLALGRALTSM